MENTQNSLYQQSQKQITPIIDYIPIQSEKQFASSAKWKLKQDLDESQLKEQEISSIKHVQKEENNYLNIESGVLDSDKKTTSIMQGHSTNTISDRNQIKNKIVNSSRGLIENYKLNMNRMGRQTNTNHSNHALRNFYKQNRPKTVSERSRSSESRSISGLRSQRGRLLNEIDRSIDNKFARINSHSISTFKKQKNSLILQILSKLEVTKSQSETLLVKSNVQTNSSQERKDYVKTSMDDKIIFKKKNKKWVEAKNALKDAVISSDTNILKTQVKESNNIKKLNIQQVMSEWKRQEQAEVIQLPNISSEHETNSLLSSLKATLNEQFSQANGSQKNKIEKFEQNYKHFPKNSQKNEENVFTFSNINPNSNLPLTYLPKHVKNVSIEVQDYGSKEMLMPVSLQNHQTPQVGCVLCNIIGKKCSFH